MYYTKEEEQREKRQSRTVGGVASLLYIVTIVLLLLLVKFQIEAEEESGGILINFGNTEEAAPGADLAQNDQIAEAPQTQQPQPEVEEVEQLTQDFEEAPEVQSVKKERPKPTEKKEEVSKPKPIEQPAEKPREVNRKALFPGRTDKSTAKSDGTGKGAGNQGDLAGDPTGGADGTGSGTGGGTATLSGRMLVGALPKPDYGAREQGRVVVEITVDQQGKVTAATFRSRGSTTSNNTLVAAALRAARQARFNVDDDAPFSQIGTITYNFRME